MKLQDVKGHIDDFFNNISAEKLYELSILKYGFSEITIDIEKKHFETGLVSNYPSTNTSVFNSNNNKEDSNSLAA